MKCPICERPTTWKNNPSRPFCSERCKLIDFGNWADENYTVPEEEDAPQDDVSREDISSEGTFDNRRYI